MFRASLVALAIYGWGAPVLDGTRPMMLDRALKSFHSDVNAVSRDAMRAIARVQHSAPVQYVTSYQRGTGTLFSARASDVLRP